LSTASVFLSHTHVDKPFVRRLGADLAALGARVWIDEAELRIGDSLLAKIGKAIDDVEYFAVVLSPEAVASSWVQNELEQAMAGQMTQGRVKVLPIYYRPCDIPGFLRGRMYADFSDSLRYDRALSLLARTLDLQDGVGGNLYDPYARQFGRHGGLSSRPVQWFCIKCGAGPMPSYNDYMCTGCGVLRPFMGGSATMVGCPHCRQMNLLIARYCEWCGHDLPVIEG
jgi:hypothetical protein